MKIIALLFPALFIVLGFFLGGMILSAANSLPLTTYVKVFADREVRAAFLLTSAVTAITTLLSAVCGLATALLIHKIGRNSSVLKTFLQLPIAVPHLAAAFIVLNLLAPSGLIARLFVSETQDFPVLVNDAYGIGIIIVYVLKETPFVALVILTTLVRTGDEFGRLAQNLGAARWQRFRFVTLPMVTPSLAFSSLLVFAYVFGAFEIPYILGRQFPAVLAITGNRKFSGTDLSERPEAFAIAVLMTIAAAIFVWLYLRLSQNSGEAGKPTLF